MRYYKTLIEIAMRSWFIKEIDDCIKSQDREFAEMRLKDYFEMVKLIKKLED